MSWGTFQSEINERYDEAGFHHFQPGRRPIQKHNDEQ